MSRERVAELAARVWAKSTPYDGTPEFWLPLWQHLDDAADVAGLIWDEWLADSVRDLISGAFDSPEQARALVIWLAASHDLGKATPAFASQGRELAGDMQHAGLTIGPFVVQERSKLRHEVASAAIAHRWLTSNTPMPEHRTEQLTCILAGHHGVYPMATAVKGAPVDQSPLFGTDVWIEVQEFLADRVAARSGISAHALEWADLRLTRPMEMILTGIVVMADWIASDEHLFPLLPYGVVPDVQAERALSSPRVAGKRARRAWRELAFRTRWTPAVPEMSMDALFADRFELRGARARPVQRAALQLAQQMNEPGLMVIEAPMGEGKTEAAMLASEILAARFGLTGCYWALPTQATTNAMFDRMLAWLQRLPDGEDRGSQAVSLVHGKAYLNESLAALPLARIHDQAQYPAPTGRLTASVHEWFRGRKRAILATFAAGTIDSILFAALTARHVMLRHLGLASKVIVIDEVHAADVYMEQFLERALTWLGACGVPVILLSATLPADRRLALHRAYRNGRSSGERAVPAENLDRERLGRRLGYPVLTATGSSEPIELTVEPSARATPVVIRRLADDLDALRDMLQSQLGDGGCAVVIRNTVRRAQETARALEEVFGSAAVTLAHAQFIAIDRITKDEDLLRRFGPPGPRTARPAGPHIVVATQVVEQSLDVDFDLMVTDLAPIDLVLQRIGRLHRHTRQGRPITEAICYVTGVEWDTAVPTPESASARIYEAWPLYRALAVLEDRWGDPLKIPHDIPQLVHDAYLGEQAPEQWAPTLDAAWSTYEARSEHRRRRAQDFLLPLPGKAGASLYGLGRASAGAVDEDSPRGQGYVRDGTDSYEVVVVQRGRDGQDRVPDWIDGGGRPLPLRSAPLEYGQALLLARCTLRLPFAMSHDGVIDAVIADLERDAFEGWAATPFLSGQLALVLDDERNASVAGFRLHYDPDRGLEVSGELE